KCRSRRLLRRPHPSTADRTVSGDAAQRPRFGIEAGADQLSDRGRLKRNTGCRNARRDPARGGEPAAISQHRGVPSRRDGLPRRPRDGTRAAPASGKSAHSRQLSASDDLRSESVIYLRLPVAPRDGVIATAAFWSENDAERALEDDRKDQ